MASTLLTSLLCLDLRTRCRRGEPVPVEFYLEPECGSLFDSESVLDLIYNEIVLREEKGETPQLVEYLQRFPALAPDLRLLFEVHNVLDSGSLPIAFNSWPDLIEAVRCAEEAIRREPTTSTLAHKLDCIFAQAAARRFFGGSLWETDFPQ